eukprot:3663033-Prymnesium_polylepis.2
MEQAVASIGEMRARLQQVKAESEALKKAGAADLSARQKDVPVLRDAVNRWTGARARAHKSLHQRARAADGAVAATAAPARGRRRCIQRDPAWPRARRWSAVGQRRMPTPLLVSADNVFVMKKQLVENFNMEPKAADKEIGLGDIDYVE